MNVALHLNWSEPDRVLNLADQHQRAEVCEVVLREGRESDVRRYVDGALLIDSWDDLVLSRRDRTAWDTVIAAELSAVSR